MKVGIGLPNAVPGAHGDDIVEFARRADKAGFSTLGTIDRIAYGNHESLVTLAAGAAVTERIGLSTSILIAPMRMNTALLAKQAATVQSISGGRLTLGVAVGGREDDYEESGADFSTRGKVFDEQLERLTSIWSGSGESGSIGPDVSSNPPQLIIGGTAGVAYERAAKHGAGWIAGGGPPDMFKTGREKLESAWSDAGRDGEPRNLALAYFSLGDNADESAQSYLKDYYSFLGDMAQQIADSAAKDADTVKGYVQAFEAAGCQELILFPTSADPEQVDLLAEAAL